MWALILLIEISTLSNLFHQAETLSPSVASYPSNLSAALFETGAYVPAIAAIGRAYNALQHNSEASENLLVRLSGRLAKALCHASSKGQLTPAILGTYHDLVQSLKEHQPADTQGTKGWWDFWEECSVTTSNRDAGVLDSQRHLAELPVRKKSM